jgi:hypothetical protein
VSIEALFRSAASSGQRPRCQARDISANDILPELR